jgi:hypothetical protein
MDYTKLEVAVPPTAPPPPNGSEFFLSESVQAVYIYGGIFCEMEKAISIIPCEFWHRQFEHIQPIF